VGSAIPRRELSIRTGDLAGSGAGNRPGHGPEIGLQPAFQPLIASPQRTGSPGSTSIRGPRWSTGSRGRGYRGIDAHGQDPKRSGGRHRGAALARDILASTTSTASPGRRWGPFSNTGISIRTWQLSRAEIPYVVARDRNYIGEGRSLRLRPGPLHPDPHDHVALLTFCDRPWWVCRMRPGSPCGAGLPELVTEIQAKSRSVWPRWRAVVAEVARRFPGRTGDRARRRMGKSLLPQSSISASSGLLSLRPWWIICGAHAGPVSRGGH